MLTPDKNTMFQDNLGDNERFHFYAPITFILAREENPNIEATKINYREDFY